MNVRRAPRQRTQMPRVCCRARARVSGGDGPAVARLLHSARAHARAVRAPRSTHTQTREMSQSGFEGGGDDDDDGVVIGWHGARATLHVTVLTALTRWPALRARRKTRGRSFPATSRPRASCASSWCAALAQPAAGRPAFARLSDARPGASRLQDSFDEFIQNTMQEIVGTCPAARRGGEPRRGRRRGRQRNARVHFPRVARLHAPRAAG